MERDLATRHAYSVKEVEDALGITHPTIYKEIEQGRLITFKVGRRRLISAKALQRWIEDREQEAREGA